MASRHDAFFSGDLYEPYVGRWSRRLAPMFIQWLDVPPGKSWIDVGCGTGALASSVLQIAEPAAVVGIDPSSGFVTYSAAKIRDPRASFRVGDAKALEFADASFDAVVAGLVLNFTGDPDRTALEMRRVARHGGTVGAYVWDYAEGMRMMRVFWDAAIELDSAALARDEGARFPICRPDALRACFEGAGLQDVDVRALDLEMAFKDFDDYWKPFLGGQAPAPAYAMSLSEEDRVRLRELVRSRLPIASNGSLDLVSRAWAVRGVAP